MQNTQTVSDVQFSITTETLTYNNNLTASNQKISGFDATISTATNNKLLEQARQAKMTADHTARLASLNATLAELENPVPTPTPDPTQGN